jgi:hypothetical protein
MISGGSRWLKLWINGSRRWSVQGNQGLELRDLEIRVRVDDSNVEDGFESLYPITGYNSKVLDMKGFEFELENYDTVEGFF